MKKLKIFEHFSIGTRVSLGTPIVMKIIEKDKE
jgi:hypothetical protein